MGVTESLSPTSLLAPLLLLTWLVTLLCLLSRALEVFVAVPPGKLGTFADTEERELPRMCEERDLRTWLITALTSTSSSHSQSGAPGRARLLFDVTEEPGAMVSGLGNAI